MKAQNLHKLLSILGKCHLKDTVRVSSDEAKFRRIGFSPHSTRNENVLAVFWIQCLFATISFLVKTELHE